MRVRIVFLGLLLGLTAAGCTTVMSTQLVGGSPVSLIPEEWEGTWSDSEDFLEIRVIDAEEGRLVEVIYNEIKSR